MRHYSGQLGNLPLSDCIIGEETAVLCFGHCWYGRLGISTRNADS
jgi:hypothetical protein